jgi:AcrR family transcriptional regulator
VTGRGDPDRTVELLWRERGRGDSRQGLSVDRIVRAAVETADAEGLEGLSMRRVAERLGFTTMSLYRHVQGKEQLVDLMCDAVAGEKARPDAGGGGSGAGADGESRGAADGGGWRDRLEAWARGGWELHRRHPWLAEVPGTRHVPGPNTIADYEYALSTVAGTGLAPSEMVAVVGLVGRFVAGEAVRLAETARVERHTGVSEEAWWGARDSLFERLGCHPVLTAVWEEGGYDRPEDPFEFGLQRVLDGVEALIRAKSDKTSDEKVACAVCGTAVVQPASGRPRAYCSQACRQRAYRDRRAVPAL